MMRRLILAGAAVASLMASPSFAQNYELEITEQLRIQGYENISMSRTWLGRTRILAMLGGDLREIVFDPNTGEILRDLSRPLMADNGTDHDSGSGSTSTVVASTATPPGSSAGVTRTQALDATAVMEGQVTTSNVIGITGPAATANGGSPGQTGTGAANANGQGALPFVILGPVGGP